MRRSATILSSAVTALLLTGGGAWAYWTAGGAGASSASAGDLDTVVLAAVTTAPGVPLLPGHTGEVVLQVQNPNSATLRLVSAVAAGPVAVSGTSGCTTADAGVTYTDQTELSVTLPPGTTVVRLPDAVTMSADAASACQGATFTVPVTITAELP